MKHAWLALLLCAACSKVSGDIQLAIIAPAGGSPFAGLSKVRLTVGHAGTPDVREGPVSADGKISLDLQLDASGAAGDVVLEGLDSAGTVKVRGRVPPFNLIAASGTFSLWVAPVGASSKLPFAVPALLGHAAVSLPFGVLFAGGSDATGAPVATVTVYDQFFLDQLASGAPLPAARRNLTGVGTDALGGAFLFGGSDGRTQPDLIRFDVTVPPNGLYRTVSLGTLDLNRVQREGARAVQLGELALVVGGTTSAGPAEGALLVSMPSVSTVDPSVTLLDFPARSAPALVATSGPSGAIVVIAGGAAAPAPAAAIFHAPPNARFTDLATASLDHVSGLAGDKLPDGRALFAAGVDDSGVPSDAVWVYDPVADAFTMMPARLETARSHATVTVVGSEVLIAGGVDAAGAVLGTAEVLDAATLAHVRTIPLADARADHSATLLPNDTVLLAGGRGGAALVPLASFEIYTPLAE